MKIKTPGAILMYKRSMILIGVALFLFFDSRTGRYGSER